MFLQMHPGLQKVAEFMQDTLSANELVSVADALQLIAPVLWGQYAKADIAALALTHGSVGDAVMASELRPREVATLSGLQTHCAAGGSAVGECGP